MTFIRDAEIESTLYKLSDPIFQVAGLEGRVDLYIIQDPTLNAFVAGGSNIFLHTGLIQELDKPEELIGVIAHETGHITGGHLARRGIAMRQATGPATVAMLLGIAAGVVSNSGDVGMAAITGGQQYIQRSLLKYTRSEEASADQAGLTYMLKAGIDPHAMITTLERFQGQEVFSSASQDPYALTHPLSYERIESLRQRIEENATNVSPVNEDLQYWHQRMRAKFDGFLEKPRDILAKIPPQTNNEFELYSLAIALHRLPDPQKASETVTKLLDIRPNDPFYHELKGQILLESGQGGQAINPYETAVSLAPDEPLLLAGLGRALLSTDTKEDNTKALKSLEDAARQDSQDASIRQYLAIAYARNGMDGMASLATAESFAIRQNIIQAKRHAEHASALLDNGSPAWIRAQDIIALPDPDDEKDR
jgi:predicted Zn-dependent protease